MSTHDAVTASDEVVQEIEVAKYTGGLVGPDVEWEGPVADGGTIVATTAPGCYGPMITPKFQGGHEVTRPVAVEGAEVGDAVALRIEEVEAHSVATASGVHRERGDAFGDDPFVDHICPGCGTEWPESVVEGTGENAIRCAECGANASSFGFEFGYTVAFDEDHEVGLTMDDDAAADLAQQAHEVMDLPENAEQHPVVLYKPSEMAGTLGRLRPFVGHIGTTPSIEMPDAHNAGDFGQFLIGATHPWGLTDEDELAHRTDAHMDIKEVREGSILVCPVKLDGGGVYLGDMHAHQGDGELALHTTDVAGTVELGVEVIEGLDIDGPLLLPNEEDLPHIAKPYSERELEKGQVLAEQYGVDLTDEMGPIQVVGSGATINEATENAYGRASDVLDISIPEVRCRCTFTGGVKVGRLPGTVQLSMLAPLDTLDEKGVGSLIREQYAI